MTNFGFNPMPNISLGDMEDIFDIENELALMTDKEVSKPPKQNTDEILKQFMLPGAPKQVVQKQAEYKDIIPKNTQTQPVQPIHPTQKIEFEVEDKDKATIEAERKAALEEQKIRERIKAAEDAKRAEEERAARLRKLAEEAELAEREAELARKKREAEQRRIEEEKRLRELRIAEEKQRAAEERERAIREAEAKRLEAEQKAKLAEQQAKLAEQQRIQQEKEKKRIELENREKAIKEAERREKLKIILAEKKRREEQQRLQQASKVTQEVKQTTVANDKYARYDSLDIDALYAEVRKFLKLHNIGKQTIDIKILENEFGKANIKKLVLKSYLISLGKGVTVGK